MKSPHTIRLHISTINDAPPDFDELFKLWGIIKGSASDIIFDFSDCSFLRPNAIAFLGGLARFMEDRNRLVKFDWDTLRDPVLAILRHNGFAAEFGYQGFSGGPGNSIPYREAKGPPAKVKDSIIDYLKYKWLGSGWLKVSIKLGDAIVGRVWEIYNNTFEHAKSSIGSFSCGQYFWQLHELKLTVVDFGVGIPANVRQYFGPDPRADQLTAAQCLKWAFEERNSTIEGIGRGNGLLLLKQFININHGTLEIYSQNGYALIKDGKEQFSNRQRYFDGTLVNITLLCDEKSYQLSDENPLDVAF